MTYKQVPMVFISTDEYQTLNSAHKILRAMYGTNLIPKEDKDLKDRLCSAMNALGALLRSDRLVEKASEPNIKEWEV